MLGASLENKIDLNYVNTNNYSSKIISRLNVSNFEMCSFRTERGSYAHSFEQRDSIKISNVLLNTESNLIYIRDQDDYKYLIESSEWSPESIILNNMRPDKRKYLTINSARLGLPNTSFYHWVSEDLPSFLLNRSDSSTLSYERTFKINSEVLNFLDRKAIKVPRWIHLDELEFVSKKPDLGKLHPTYARTLQEFAAMVVGKVSSGYNNFYISRRKSRRSLKDEEFIEFELAKLNVKIVYAEDYSFLDQIKLFSTAKNIIGIQGAGLVHSIWSRNCNLIEIDNNRDLNRCYEWQTLLLNGTFHSISLEQNYNQKEIIDQISEAIH
jgi:hypothetical protein